MQLVDSDRLISRDRMYCIQESMCVCVCVCVCMYVCSLISIGQLEWLWPKTLFDLSFWPACRRPQVQSEPHKHMVIQSDTQTPTNPHKRERHPFMNVNTLFN